MQKLQTAGGSRGREAGPADARLRQRASAALGGARKNSPLACNVVMKERVDCVSRPLASRFSVSNDSSWTRRRKFVRFCLP